MSVHGPMMACFPDEFRTFSYYTMDATINSGYENKGPVHKSRGVLHMYSAPPTAEGVKLRNIGANTIVEKKPFLWSRTIVPVGYFIQMINEVYRVISHNEWGYEASMTLHGLERVVGDNGALTNDVTINTGYDSLS